ncbi:MAG: VanZ family protein [Thermoanaerobaculales bacterium]|jgi:hypothetical protein|nr:VanZ family protein [Thermoanaerobaculales bacterium]
MAPRNRQWLAVAVWVAVIYTAIPFVRVLRDAARARWDLGSVSLVVAALLAASAVGGAICLRRSGTGLRPGALGWLALVTLALVLWAYGLRRVPEESVHLVEYGALAVLLHRALRSSIPDPAVFAAAAIVGAMVGTVDEAIQWVVPSRTWDWRDVAINAGAGALVQLGLWRAVWMPVRRVSASSLRLLLRLAAAALLLVTLCLANTPARVARYAPRLPHAGHLTSTLNPMAEYGRRHLVPGIGAFASRLTLDELAENDRRRADEAAATVDAYLHRYGEFLDTWPVADDPFTYELRVHLFARDRNLAKAREAGATGSEAREHLSIAWSENLLIERFFSASLARSAYPWGETLRQRVDSTRDPDHRFVSAVGSHLITIAPEGALRVVLLAAVVGLLAIDRARGRAREGEP